MGNESNEKVMNNGFIKFVELIELGLVEERN